MTAETRLAWPDRTAIPPGPVISGRHEYVEQELVEEEFLTVRDARIIFANYELIAHDFAPHLAGLQRADIDAWLLRHAAIVSAAQAAQHVVNAPIATGSRTVRAFRPPCYGRAAVVETPETCLLDVKGVGAAPGVMPLRATHATGLLALTYAIYEVLFEWLAAAVLAHSPGTCTVVPSYALIDLGFDIFDPGVGRCRASALVRRAHTRPRIQWGSEDPGPAVAAILRDVVLQLRHAGLDATIPTWKLKRHDGGVILTAYRQKFRFEGEEAERIATLTRCRDAAFVEAVNVQFTGAMREPQPRVQIVDFGGFSARCRFANPLFSPTVASYLALLGEMTFPDDPGYVRTASRRIPWSASERRLARLLAEAYRRGVCSGDELRRRLLALVDAAIGHPEHR